MVLRTWLWGAVSEDDPTDCLLGAISDLASATRNTDRIVLTEYIRQAIGQLTSEGITFDRIAVAKAAEQLNTEEWSLVMVRGYYGTMLRLQFRGRFRSRQQST